MSAIFLSYKKEDKKKARLIAKAFEQHNFSVWWDVVIPPGQTFDEVIEAEIKAAKCVVVLWSKESVNSQWVRNEAYEGSRRKILIPVLIEDVLPPFAFRLIQAANLIDWDGTLPNREFDLLLGSVASKLEQPVKPISENQNIIENDINKKNLKENTNNKNLKKEANIKNRMKTEEKQIGSENEIGENFLINSVGMKFELIPAGEFIMGSKEYDWEKPVHKVTINKPFYLGIYPVTQKQWMDLMDQNPSYLLGDELPVETVAWNDVMDFINKLNILERTTNYYLPSEAEWEYAARSGTNTRFFFGDDESIIGDYAWYSGNSKGKTKPVGHKKPNPWGLYDVLGNVWEWVEDNGHENYQGAPTDGSTWVCRDCSNRMNRGGSWDTLPISCRSASRTEDEADFRANTLGFRIMKIL